MNEDIEECVICFYEKPIQDYICFSCGHKVCNLCYPLMNNMCPICRFKEVDLIHIEIVIPSRPSNDLSTNYRRILSNTLCVCFIFIIIYIVIISIQQTF